jgi:hypothetical protein
MNELVWSVILGLASVIFGMMLNIAVDSCKHKDHVGG